MPLLVIGSNNVKKRDELRDLVGPYGIEVATLADYPERAVEVIEDGDTFEANAEKKAFEQAASLGQWVLADDSGICVDALGGAPGILSARFSGEHGDDQANNRLLLEKLGDLPPEKRGAHYGAVIALADPTGAIRATTRGECHGRITNEPRGENGFGYDPLFEIREYHRTFGQMGPAVKRAISHRSQAMRAILPKLLELVQG